jgi:hypothetical protein
MPITKRPPAPAIVAPGRHLQRGADRLDALAGSARLVNPCGSASACRLTAGR